MKRVNVLKEQDAYQVSIPNSDESQEIVEEFPPQTTIAQRVAEHQTDEVEDSYLQLRTQDSSDQEVEEELQSFPEEEEEKVFEETQGLFERKMEDEFIVEEVSKHRPSNSGVVHLSHEPGLSSLFAALAVGFVVGMMIYVGLGTDFISPSIPQDISKWANKTADDFNETYDKFMTRIGVEKEVPLAAAPIVTANETEAAEMVVKKPLVKTDSKSRAKLKEPEEKTAKSKEAVKTKTTNVSEDSGIRVFRIPNSL